MSIFYRAAMKKLKDVQTHLASE